MSQLEISLIGIAGGSCSGKTTLANELEAKLSDKVVRLSFDDYFVGLEMLRGIQVDDWESPTLYDWQRFISDLKRLRVGNSIMIGCNSRESVEKGVRSKLIIPRRFTLVEGFLIFHDPEARKCFDKRIFVDISEEELIRRRLSRIKGSEGWDDPEYIKNKLIPGHKRYVLPQKEHGQLVIDGTQPIEWLVDQVIDFISIT